MSINLRGKNIAEGDFHNKIIVGGWSVQVDGMVVTCCIDSKNALKCNPSTLL